MQKLKTFGNHKCAPEEWRRTQDLTGSFELDAAIARNPNKDMARKLVDHLASDEAYKINTAYGRGPVS